MICQNRRAFHDYQVFDRLECGLVLTGTEVKSLRAGHANLEDAYGKLDGGELWLVGCEIPEYERARTSTTSRSGTRKLLAHRNEIGKFAAKAAQKRLHAGSAPALLQGWPSQGGTGGGAGQAEARQTPGPERGRGEAGHQPGDAAAPGSMTACRVYPGGLPRGSGQGGPTMHLVGIVEPINPLLRPLSGWKRYRPYLEKRGHSLERPRCPTASGRA